MFAGVGVQQVHRSDANSYGADCCQGVSRDRRWGFPLEIGAGIFAQAFCVIGGAIAELRDRLAGLMRDLLAEVGGSALGVVDRGACVAGQIGGVIERMICPIGNIVAQVLGGLGDLPVKNICLEFSPDNLKNCGFSPADLWNLPLWKNYRLALLEKETARPIYFKPGEPPSNETEIVWAQALA